MVARFTWRSLLFLVVFAGVAAGAEPEKRDLPAAPSAVLAETQGQVPEQARQGGQETEAERRAREQAEAEREVKTQEGQRILSVVPNFNTVITGQGVRLSNGQKTELAFRATIDPFNVVGSFVLAGLSEVGDTHRGYGWGPGGYFKRVGANGADIVVGTMLAGAAYPILLHQDPRFFRQGKGTIKSRIRHALLSAVVCRGDHGQKQPNYSNVLGNFTAGALSNLYYPENERGVGLAMVNSSVVTLEGALGNIGLEFSPDVAAWWRQRRGKGERVGSGRAE